MVLNRFSKKLTALAGAALILSTSLFALAVPELKAHVNDYANVLKQKDEQEIENYLTNLEQQTGVQIAVLTIDTLNGESIEAFANKVANTWKLGSAKEDNGALLVVAESEHMVRLEIGDGLEGAITDVKCGLIIRNVIIPEFKNGNYAEGIYKGVKNMGGLATNNQEIVDKKVLNEEEPDDMVAYIFMIIWFGFIIFIIITSIKNKRVPVYVNGIPIYRGTGTSRTNFTGGSFGGGFGGGGGHFSGGGASGHW